MNYQLSISQKKIEFRAAMQFFEIIHNSRRNRLVKWNNYNSSQYQEIFLDYNGRELLINSLQNNIFYNNIAIHVYLPYEVQIPFFMLINTKKMNTTFMFSNGQICKPYFGNMYNEGILEDYIRNVQMGLYIQFFATNVLRILKLSTNPLIYAKKANKRINDYLFNTSVEISTMILTTERLRSEKALLISYIEFYKLKYTNNIGDSRKRLMMMFNRSDSSMIFASKGGARGIIGINPSYLYHKFIEMLKFSPVYEIFKKLPKSMQDELYDEFYKGKLDKLKSMSANHPPLYQSKFKIFTRSSERFYYLKRKRILNAWMKCTKTKNISSTVYPQDQI